MVFPRRPGDAHTRFAGRPQYNVHERGAVASRASAINVRSLTASTSPSPNSGVVMRDARRFASGGTTSGTKLNEPLGVVTTPIAWSWISEPPSDAVVRQPSLLRDVHAYVRNAAAWLGR